MTLRDLRLQAGLYQEDVAKKLQVDQSCVSKWDSGHSSPMKKCQKKLAKLYKCTDEELAEAIKASRGI